tara:strand:+ start:111 stop:977 length:867 start_codon:yes stop_codon:yes gene_type:complete
MNKTTKIALFSIGGLALATGLFFAIKAFIPKSDNEFDEKDQLDYNRLLEKERKGTLSDRERDELENLRNQTEKPNDDEIGGSKICASSFGNNSQGICVAKMQLAINQKHDNTWSGDGVGGDIDYPCEGAGKKLGVDGIMGSNTMKAINKFYPGSRLCVRANTFACHCTGTISTSIYNKIIQGADTSNEALKSAGYEFKTGEESSNNFSGNLNSGYSNFNLTNKEQLRGSGQLEWRATQGVMGDFYPNSNGFIEQPVIETNLEKSYGMRNFGGDVSTNLPTLDIYGRKL